MTSDGNLSELHSQEILSGDYFLVFEILKNVCILL
jgi:hypothetical protein